MNSLITLPSSKILISPVGLQIHSQLTLEEWHSLATSIGHLARSVGFIVGDWLVYGQSLLGMEGQPDRRVDADAYRIAMEATGLDLSTLQNYAYVSRSVPFSVRSESLSWEHHRLLAKLPEDQQKEWIEICLRENENGERMTTRRLRKSVNLGRLANPEEVTPDNSDKGVENHIPYVNRLAVWWKRMKQAEFLANATEDQRAAIKRDLKPIVSIYNEL